MFLFDDGNGNTHQISSGSDMLKALGQDDRPMIFITDEKGALVGTGLGVEGAQRSAPLIKALRDARPMAKSLQPRIFLKKSTGFSDRLNQLTQINKSISDLQKSMNVGVLVSDDGASNDVWSVVDDLNARMSAIEASIKNISDFISSL